MGVTIIDRLVSAGAALTGSVYRAVSGTDENANARPLLTDFDGSLRVSPGDASCDAFGRLRAADAQAVFTSKQLYGKDTLLFDESVTGTGATTFLSNNASVQMNVSASGDTAIRQTRQYFPYVPGQSQLILATGVLDDGGNDDVNVRTRIGYFDANNGFFFQKQGTTLSVVRRTFVTGSPDDSDAVTQANWNLDKLNGTGPSGVTLAPENTNIYIVDLAWLGVGSVRMGVQIGGRIIYVHEFKNENSITTVYMSTPTLPVRYEITATGAPGGTRSMRHICAAVYSEGATEALDTIETANVGVTARTATSNTLLPLLSVRAQSGFKRVTLDPIHFSVLPTTAIDYLVEVYIGATITGATFAAGTTGFADIDTAGTAISAFRAKIFSDYGSSTAQGGGAISDTLKTAIKAASDIAGSTADAITVAVTPDGAGADFLGSLTWKAIT